MEMQAWARLFDLCQSPSRSEFALFEKLERYMTASFRRLTPSTSSGTRNPKSMCASAQTTSIRDHDRDHRRALQCEDLFRREFRSSKSSRDERRTIAAGAQACLSRSDNARLSSPWREVIFLSTGLSSISGRLAAGASLFSHNPRE